MRVIELRSAFGTQNLVLADRPRPEPQAGQVLLRMRAASLNYRDLLMVRGHYNPRQPLPLVPCSDGVGEVVATGSGVTRVEVSDRVAPIFALDWLSGEPSRSVLASTLGGPLDGTLSEYMALDEQSVVRVPQHLTDEEAASLPCAALTAWSALVTHGSLKAGNTVLVQGTGGVSIFALQFATLLGARVIVTSRSDEKLARARDLGAWETINYESVPEWGKRALELTGGDGVDIVVEVGGAGTLARSLQAVRFGGQISLIGILAGSSAELSVIPILMHGVRVQGILVGHRDGFEAMNDAIAWHGMRPVIDDVFPMQQTRRALEHMADGKHFGKICVRIVPDG